MFVIVIQNGYKFHSIADFRWEKKIKILFLSSDKRKHSLCRLMLLSS